MVGRTKQGRRLSRPRGRRRQEGGGQSRPTRQPPRPTTGSIAALAAKLRGSVQQRQGGGCSNEVLRGAEQKAQHVYKEVGLGDRS